MEILISPLDDAVLSAMRQPYVMTAMAAKIQFPSGISRVHSGTGELVIGGELYYGAGAMGEISSITEEHTTSPGQISLSLGGFDTSLIATTLNERVVGAPVDIYLVVFNGNGVSIAACLLYSGKISATAMTAGDDAGISYTVSNVFEDWSRSKGDRYTDESQRRRTRAVGVDDRIFRYVSQMSERALYWGNKTDAPAFNYG